MTPIEQAKAALEDIATNYEHDDDAHKYGTPCRMCVAAEALTALSTIEGSGERKVLTDDMIATVESVERQSYLREHCSDTEARIWAKGVASGLRQARDNGLLVRSPSLSVDEVEQAVKEWCFNWCERVAPDQSDWADLRERLTKAIKP